MRIAQIEKTKGTMAALAASSLATGFALSVLIVCVAANRVRAEDESDLATKELQSSCPEGAGIELAARIQSRYEGIRDIQANFEQVTESATFAGQPLMDAEAKRGHVTFAKPGKMRWTYLSPEPSVVVSNGELLWIHDVAGQSVTRLAVTAGFLSGAALQFLLGDGQILETFDVVAAECRESQVALELNPKAAATYDQLGLVADPETGQLIATSVLDLFGNRTSIRFSDTRTNLDPEDATFELEIPEGVEVIDFLGHSSSVSEGSLEAGPVGVEAAEASLGSPIH